MLSYKENMQMMWEGFCQTSVLPAVIWFQAQQTTYVAWKSPDKFFFFFFKSATHSLQSLNTAIKDVCINMELYSDFQFFAYPSKHNFTALVHC